MTPSFYDILKFWLGDLNDESRIDKSPVSRRWFRGDKQLDEEIRKKFEDNLKKAARGELSSWEEGPRGRLALVILFDQFSRSMYRNTPQMFACDSLALNLTLRTMFKKIDQQLQLVERVFLYMPLQHAEDIELQKLSLQRFESLVIQSEKMCPSNTPYYASTLQYAKRHHDIIAEFGRFPHRNAILNRSSTEGETDFLKKPGSSF